MDKTIQNEFKREMGFTPPGIMVSDKFGQDFSRLMTDFHHSVWSDEDAIPIKYRHLMSLATAVYGNDEKRSRLEIVKAINQGATMEEFLDVFKQQVWIKGAPTLVQIAPLIEMLEIKLGTKK